MIKTKQITTPKCTLLVIGGLPEDTKIALSSNVTFNGEQGSLIYKGKDGNPVFIPLPSGKWQPIGFLKDIPEDEAKELVEDPLAFQQVGFSEGFPPIGKPYLKYADYKNSNMPEFDTATESLHSLVESEVGDYKIPYEARQPGESIGFTNPYILIKK